LYYSIKKYEQENEKTCVATRTQMMIVDLEYQTLTFHSKQWKKTKEEEEEEEDRSNIVDNGNE
jgi:hypothetical protein